MRKGWKALLTMPHLRWLEVHIMPVEVLLPAREVKYIEVRNIAPFVFRFWAKGVFPSVYLCVSNENKSPPIGTYMDQNLCLDSEYSVHDISYFFPIFARLNKGQADELREVARALEPDPSISEEILEEPWLASA